MVSVYISETSTRSVDQHAAPWAFVAFQRGRWRVVDGTDKVLSCGSGRPKDRGGYKAQIEAKLRAAQINRILLDSLPPVQ